MICLAFDAGAWRGDVRGFARLQIGGRRVVRKRGHRGRWRRCDASFTVEVSGGAYDLVKNPDGTYRVQNVGPVDVAGATAIRLPDNAPQSLKEHESGHGDLYREEYNRIAKEETEAAFRGFEGMKFSDPDAAAKAAAERDRRLELAAQAIQQKLETLNAKYDNLPQHGTSATVNTAQGKAQALKERDDAIRAKKDPPQPPENQPRGLTIRLR